MGRTRLSIIFLIYFQAKVKAAKNRFILLEVYVYNIKNPKSKELVDSMTLLDNEVRISPNHI
jgi:hypothetical protein